MAEKKPWELMGITKEEYENLVNKELKRIEKDHPKDNRKYEPWKLLDMTEAEWNQHVNQAFARVQEKLPPTEREELIRAIRRSGQRAEVAAKLVLDQKMNPIAAKEEALRRVPPTDGLSKQEKALLNRIVGLATKKRTTREWEEVRRAEAWAKSRRRG